MIHRTRAITALIAIVGGLSGAARAATPDPSVASCYKAFEAMLSTKFRAKPRVTENHVFDAPSVWSPVPSSATEYTMTATNPKTHETVLQANCTIKGDDRRIDIKETEVSSL
jgi:hypothetical protein